MSNTININGMTGYYNSFIKSVTPKTSVGIGTTNDKGFVAGEKDSFVSTLGSKVESVNSSEETNAVSKKDMTLEEYKQYINEVISNYNIHPSHFCDSYAISISDAGFKAMQDDPEYEKWVMDNIKGMLGNGFSSSSRALTGDLCCVCNFGASKEECRCLSWSEGYQNGNGKSIWEEKEEDSFWSRRGEQKKVQEQADKKAAVKRDLEKKLQQEAIERWQAYTDFLNRKAMLQINNKSEFTDMFTMPVDERVSGIITAYEIGTFATGGMI